MRSISILGGLAVSLLALSVHAATQPPVDAGLLQQNLDKAPLQLPGKQRLNLTLPDTPADEARSGGPTLQVADFILEGVSVDSLQLLALLDDLKNRRLTFGELQAGANRITRWYREQGYPLARAYIPAQEIDAGVLRIAVLEGRFGQVQISNRAGLRGGARAPLAALQPGDTVRAATLERSLLLMQDTPGVAVSSTLRPGSHTGETDLLVDVQRAPLLSGALDADNYGNRYTGEYRLGASLQLNGLAGLGDRLSLRAMTSDQMLLHGRIAYQLPLGPWATQVGAAYSSMHYELGKDFEDLKASGTANIASLYAIQPLLRSRDLSLSLQAQLDSKDLQDDIDLYNEQNGKQADVFSLTLSGNSRDAWQGGGMNSFALALSTGSLDIENAAQRQNDRQTARTQGSFLKLNPSLVRLQRLTDTLSLYTQVQGQWANGNLDSSEKFSLGGAYGVRAYPQGEASGDLGWLANVEVRYALSDAWQLNGFLDHGQVRINQDAWTSDDNSRSLSGAGVGASWTGYGWQVNGVAAFKLGGEEAESDKDRGARLWVQVVKPL